MDYPLVHKSVDWLLRVLLQLLYSLLVLLPLLPLLLRHCGQGKKNQLNFLCANCNHRIGYANPNASACRMHWRFSLSQKSKGAILRKRLIVNKHLHSQFTLEIFTLTAAAVKLSKRTKVMPVTTIRLQSLCLSTINDHQHHRQHIRE